MSAVAETEAALFLNRMGGPLPAGYSRLYFGAEFCPWLLPQAAEAVAACRAAHELGWHFTLALPVLTESVLPRLRSLLETLVGQVGPGDEVLISDWGALALVRELLPRTTVLLGRALSGQKRGPRILDLSLTAEQREYFQRGSWYGRDACALLGEEKIARVELDNLLQGMAPLPPGLVGSLHYPYALVTSSRNCPFRIERQATGCAACCGEVFSLESDQTRVPLLQGGNTQFLHNQELPADLLALGIDRLVHHPFLPC
jgi:hypothetical protein